VSKDLEAEVCSDRLEGGKVSAEFKRVLKSISKM